MKRSITLRYSLALTIVASVIITSYVIIAALIETRDNQSHIVNVSGMQRMLSQRIGLYALILENTIASQKDDDAILNNNLLNLHKEALEEAVMKMEENHLSLISGNLGEQGTYVLSDAVKNMYFNTEEMNLNQRVKGFLENAKNLIRHFSESDVESIKNYDYGTLASEGSCSMLLQDLNSLVSQYEAEAEEATELFKQYETKILLFGLAVLLLEALFIFRPLTNSIVAKTKLLEEKNIELQRFTFRVLHDIRSPLSSVISQTELVTRYLSNSGNAAIESLSDKVTKSLMELRGFTDRMLDQSRIKTAETRIKSVDVETIIAESIADVKDTANDVRLKILLEATDIPSDLRLNEVMLKHVVKNMTLHAVACSDANAAQADAMKVTFFARYHNQELRLLCRYQANATDEAKDAVFETSLSPDGATKAAGETGLVLVNLKLALEKVNGTAHYELTDEGAELSCTMPVGA